MCPSVLHTVISYVLPATTTEANQALGNIFKRFPAEKLRNLEKSDIALSNPAYDDHHAHAHAHAHACI